MCDTHRHAALLEQHRLTLVTLLDVTDTLLLDGLKQHGVLGTQQLEALMAEKNNYPRASALISLLTKKPPEHFKTFLECLRKFNHSHVADILDYCRPEIYLFSPTRNKNELGLQAILEEMKSTIRFVDKHIEARILTPAEMKDIHTHHSKRIIGVIPDTAEAAAAFSDLTEKQMCGIVAVTRSSASENEKRRIVRYMDELALTCFMSVDVFEDWKHHLNPADHHRRMVYIPVSLSTHETYFIEPLFKRPVQVVIDMQTMENIPEHFETILQVVEEINDQNEAELKLCLLLRPGMLHIKDNLVQKTKGRNTEIDYVECIQKSDVNEMKENSIWLFPGGDKYLTWTSLRPTIHGIPQIITKDSQLFHIHQHAEPCLKEGMIWKNTSGDTLSARNLKECLSSILDDLQKAFDNARSFSKWFLCFEYVIKSTTKFLQYALDSNLAQVVIRVQDCLNQNTKVMADMLLSAQVGMNDSPLHQLVREAWSKHMEDTVLIGVESGSIILYVYVADIESMNQLQRRFRNGSLGEAMLELMLILWRNSYPELSLSEAMLDLELSPPFLLRAMFQVERREAAMNSIEKALSDKGSQKLPRFNVVTSGKTYELSAQDARTRDEWVAATQAAVDASDTSVYKQQKAFQLRSKQRNALRAKQQEEEEKRRAEEERRKAEEEQRERELEATREQVAAMQREKEELERLKNKMMEKSARELEQEKMAIEEVEAQLPGEMALREAERRYVKELQDMKKELEELLEAERQAKKDEEIVRMLQARLLEEEQENREELEKSRQDFEETLQKERQRLEGQEQQLREEQLRLEQLEAERLAADIQRHDALAKLAKAEKSRSELQAKLKEKREGFLMISHRGLGAFSEADFSKRQVINTNVKKDTPTADLKEEQVTAAIGEGHSETEVGE